ncbi:MAG: hypothetical protein JXQ96_23320 [Cyclobacteriaceae bacterium]
MEFNDEYFKSISKNGIHKYYKKTVDHAEEMGVHVEGDKPEKLLNINRPNEQKEIKKYRLESYEPVTKSLSEKVVNTVNKIFNPRIWSLNFPEMTKVVGEDTLSKYLMEDYPYYRSIMNFITETFTTKDFSDPNAAIVVMPEDFDIEETEMFNPVAVIYGSETLKDFVDGEYYTFMMDGVIKVFTQTEILYYKKNTKGGKENWNLYFEYKHDFGLPPVFRLGGIINGKQEPYYFESWIRGVLPHWNQVVQLTSDAHASYMNHLWMEKWEYATECEAEGCNGGLVETEIKNGKDIVLGSVHCRNCNGTGKVSKSPYGIHTINRDAINPDAPLPTPPAGYISKPIDIIDKVEDRISKEEKRGLASINMEIVQMVGEDQSGLAKTVDREDLNAFLSRYSRHVFEYVLPELIFYIAAWRYGEIYTLSDILPEINQPKDFNVLNLNQLTEEYKNASNSGVSNSYLMNVEKELVESKFSNNDLSRRKNTALIDLNPYPNRSDDDLLTLQNLGEPSWMIYKAIHLIELVEMAIEDDSEFLNLTLKEQREKIDNLSKEKTGFIEDPVVVDSI